MSAILLTLILEKMLKVSNKGTQAKVAMLIGDHVLRQFNSLVNVWPFLPKYFEF